MNKVSSSAWGATIIWVGIIGWVAYTKRTEFAGMAPNAIGDFLAGTVSPLALIWLVAGYLQQGKELQQNTQALLLQQIEMQNQVAEFKKLATHSEQQAAASLAMVEVNVKEQLARERAEIDAIQPKFKFQFTSMNGDDQEFSMLNTGVDAHNVELTCGSYKTIFIHDLGYEFIKGQNRSVQFELFVPGSPHDGFMVDVSYTDISGKPRVQRYQIGMDFSYFVEYL